MTRDLKHRIPAYRRRKQRHLRRWSIAALGVAAVAGTVLLGMRFLPDRDSDGTEILPAPPPHTANPPAPSKPEGSGKSAIQDPQQTGKNPAQKPGITQTPEPRFTFYKILPEKEVIIPESEIKTIKREESLGKKPQTGLYLVQAGSFTNQQDAEKLKAQLAQIKLKAKLEMIKIENTSWFRVKVGPYATLADADRVRIYLRNNNIDSVVQKATK